MTETTRLVVSMCGLTMLLCVTVLCSVQEVRCGVLRLCMAANLVCMAPVVPMMLRTVSVLDGIMVDRYYRWFGLTARRMRSLIRFGSMARAVLKCILCM